MTYIAMSCYMQMEGNYAYLWVGGGVWLWSLTDICQASVIMAMASLWVLPAYRAFIQTGAQVIATNVGISPVR